jgi:hypothetical protein
MKSAFIILALLLGGSLCFGQLTVTVSSVTATQAVLEYVAPVSGSTCTVKVSESNTMSPVVNDVNETLFPGSSSDRLRSSTTLDLMEVKRTVTIGARTSDVSSDGKLYSRALQANTLHYYSVTCGAVSATGTFQTANPPLGNTYPEVPPFNAAGFGNYAWPSIDWTDASKTYIDPMTGVLLKLAYQPPGRQGNMQWGSGDEAAFKAAIDLNGAWSNASNVLNTSTSGPFASYSGANRDPLFLIFGPMTVGGYDSATWIPSPSIDDIRLTLYGSGSGTADDRTILACLAVFFKPSNGNCTSQEIEITLPTSTGSTAGPANYPKMPLAGWNVGRILKHDETSVPHGKLNLAAKVATVNESDVYEGHYIPFATPSGVKVYIAGSAPACPGNWCTFDKLLDARSFTIVEDPGTLTNADFQLGAFGIRIRKKTTSGTVNVAASYMYAWSQPPQMPLNGVADFCSRSTVTVDYAADGVTKLPAPETGYLCIENNGGSGPAEAILVVLLPRTGEARTLTQFRHGGFVGLPYQSFSESDPLSLFAVLPDDTDSSKDAIYQISYDPTACHWKAFPGDNYRYGSTPNDCMTWTNITPASQNKSPIQQLTASIQGSPWWDATLSPNGRLNYVGMVGKYAVFSYYFGGPTQSVQDAPCWVSRFDVTSGQLVQVIDTFASPGGRWAGCHYVGPGGSGDWYWMAASLLRYNRGGSSNYLAGPYYLRSIYQMYKSGVWGTDTSLTNTYADTCTTTDPAMIALGATGRRCVKIRINSLWPYAAYTNTREVAKWPCPYDASKSCPMQITVGDYIADPDLAKQHGDSWDGKAEKMLITSITDIGSGNYEIELMRWAACDSDPYYSHIDSPEHSTHTNGWLGWMTGTGLCSGNTWWTKTGENRWYNEDGVLSSGHSAMGPGPNGTFSLSVEGYAHRVAKPMPDQIGKPADWKNQADMMGGFGGVTVAQASGIESYPNHGQWNAPDSEKNWILDFRHFNPSFGSGPERPSTVWTNTYTLVAGTTQVYKVQSPGVIFGKVLPYLAFSGRNLLKDKSGPASLITDADTYKFCVAYIAGECRPGSAKNDVFVNAPYVRTDWSGNCMVNTYAQNGVCFNTVVAQGASVIQMDISEPDPLFRNFRRLTMGFTGPGRQYQFMNASATPDGQWAFMNAGWLDGYRADMLLLKIPPMPVEDTINRRDFVRLRETLAPNPLAPQARIRFGYAENGPVSSFFCTSRQESCLTDAQLTPFAYEQTDALNATACGGGCTIEIPAIPGRVVYYRVERLDTQGNLVFTGPTKAYGVR